MLPRSLICCFIALAAECASQAIHTVIVGSGSFYIPPTTSALKGDIITFFFTGKSHSVTQSNFSTPCSTLPGGFDSDMWGPKQASDPIPQWNLTITDDSQPIWLYCKGTTPQSHCGAGMVGAINPPTGTDQNFTAFRDAAKAITTPPVFTPGAVLTGVGAFATAVPTPITQSGLSTSSTSLETSTTSATTSPSSSSINTPTDLSAAQIGGIVGGVLGGIILFGILLLVILMYHWERSSQSSKDDRETYLSSMSTITPVPRMKGKSPAQLIAEGNYSNEPNAPDEFGIIPPVTNHNIDDSYERRLNHSSWAYNPHPARNRLSSITGANVQELASEIVTILQAGDQNQRHALPPVSEHQNTAHASSRSGAAPVSAGQDILLNA